MTDSIHPPTDLAQPASPSPAIGKVLLELIIVFSPIFVTPWVVSQYAPDNFYTSFANALSIVVSMVLATVMLRRSDSGGLTWA